MREFHGIKCKDECFFCKINHQKDEKIYMSFCDVVLCEKHHSFIFNNSIVFPQIDKYNFFDCLPSSDQ